MRFLHWLLNRKIDTDKFTKKQQFPMGKRYVDDTGQPWIYVKKVKE